MKKLALLTVFFSVALWLCSSVSHATSNRLNEPGNILVFPLIDNINANTIVTIVNLGQKDCFLSGLAVVHPDGRPHDFVKKNFVIHVTQKEVFWWQTNKPYNRSNVHGKITQIQGFNGYKGAMFVKVIDGEPNSLTGDALVFNSALGRAFQYNAIPHQIIDGPYANSFTEQATQIMFEGFAGGVSGIEGTLAVANLDIDFGSSDAAEFDINFEVYNQNEVAQSRHVHFEQFEQYDLHDLQLELREIFTPKWHATSTSPYPLWAVFFQYSGDLAWGGNVWQHPEKE
jgi:hypothetical protein